jgi:outer membrane protein TolC
MKFNLAPERATFTSKRRPQSACSLFLASLIAALAGLEAHAAPVAEERSQTVDARFLDQLRAEVRTNHPSAAAAQARILAAEAGARSVRLWEDPVAGFGVMAAERDMRRDDGDLIFSLEQVLPRKRLFEARKARALAERSVREAEARSVILTLEEEAAKSAIELAFADETLAVQTNQLKWIESIAANARERVKDPGASASEALRMEGELAKEKQAIQSTARTRKRLARQLNILLGREPDQSWPPLKLPPAPAAPSPLNSDLDQLLASNPRLQALVGTVEAARAEVSVVKREQRPVLSVGIDSSVYSGGDFRQATVGAKVSLPWFNRSVYRANIERSQRDEIAASRELDALSRDLRGRAVAAHTEAENAALQALTLSGEVIPRMEKAAQSTEGAWITLKASLLEVLDARRALLSARLEERRSVAAYGASFETLRSIIPTPTSR